MKIHRNHRFRTTAKYKTKYKIAILSKRRRIARDGASEELPNNTIKAEKAKDPESQNC